MVIGVGICAFIYATVGIFGYLHFLDDTTDNILLNFDNKDILVDVVKIAFLFIMIFSYPLLGFPFR